MNVWLEIEVMVDPNALNPVLTIEETKLDHASLIVTDNGCGKWSVKLRDPPDQSQLLPQQPPDNDLALTSFQKYSKSMLGTSPHRYMKALFILLL